MRFPWGEVLVGPRAPDQTAPASYDWRGTRYEWHPKLAPEVRAVLDVERLDTPKPGVLVPKGWDKLAFLAAWTQAEAMCKLLDVPILIWLKANGIETVNVDVWVQGDDPLHRRCWTYTRFCRSESIVCTFGIKSRKSGNTAV